MQQTQYLLLDLYGGYIESLAQRGSEALIALPYFDEKLDLFQDQRNDAPSAPRSQGGSPGRPAENADIPKFDKIHDLGIRVADRAQHF